MVDYLFWLEHVIISVLLLSQLYLSFFFHPDATSQTRLKNLS